MNFETREKVIYLTLIVVCMLQVNFTTISSQLTPSCMIDILDEIHEGFARALRLYGVQSIMVQSESCFVVAGQCRYALSLTHIQKHTHTRTITRTFTHTQAQANNESIFSGKSSTKPS